MTSRLTRSEMLMALAACLSFLYVAGIWAFLSVPLTIAILASWYVPQRYSSTPRRQRAVFSVLGLPFLLLGLYFFFQGGVIGFQRIAVLGAVYVLAGAVLELYRCPEEARPAVFHAGIVVVMLVGGLTRANPYYFFFLLAYAVGLVGLLIRPVSGMTGGPGPRTDGSAPKVVLVAGLLLSVPLSSFYFTLLPRVSRALYNSYASTLTGNKLGEALLFRPNSDLSTIQDLRGSDAVWGRVFGPPTLLRGKVFHRFQNGVWSGVEARAERELLTSDTGRFSLGKKKREGLKVWRIEPVKILSGPLAVPAGAVEIVSALEELEIDPFDGLEADNEQPYQVVAGGYPDQDIGGRRLLPDSPGWRDAYVTLPDNLKEPLLSHSRTMLGNRSLSDKETARGLETFLARNGRYDPGAPHSRRDPILHFLGDGNLRGHCEYFATSMVLLLRSRGIPARYVVGYIAQERNPLGDYLIVRDRDAHAWVEAYVEGRWRVFDPTPAAELAEANPRGWETPTLEAVVDYLKYLSSGFWRWVAGLEGEELEQQLLLLFLGFSVLVGLGLLYRFRHRLLAWRAPSGEVDPLLSLGRRCFREFAARGLEKAASETPLEFACKIRNPEASGWLEEYAKFRYGGATAEQVAELESKLEKLFEE